MKKFVIHYCKIDNASRDGRASFWESDTFSAYDKAASQVTKERVKDRTEECFIRFYESSQNVYVSVFIGYIIIRQIDIL